MFCQKCGTQNPDEGNFCSKCGNDLKSTIQTEKKGITGKLGNMGVPGFRSGKSWKMGLAFIGYFFIFIILLALISPSPAPKTSLSTDSPISRTPETTVQKTPTSLLTPTPTAKSDEQIIIKFGSKMTNSIGQYSQASPGKTFLIVTMTIENKGYQSLNTNPNYFNIVIDNIKYSYAPETYQLTDKLETIDILNGGTITGSIAFSVPKNTTQYKFSYEQAFRNYNIGYVADNPVP